MFVQLQFEKGRLTACQPNDHLTYLEFVLIYLRKAVNDSDRSVHI